MISVIMPVYDRTKMLEESIESILAQGYENFELIIVTDGSPTETLQVLDRYVDNPKIKIYRRYGQSGNAVRGRNKGIVESLGEYIAFQDSDDIAEPDRLRCSLEYITRFRADVVYGAWKVKLQGPTHDRNLRDGMIVESPEVTWDVLKAINIPAQGSVMARKSALVAVGGLKKCMGYLEDYELWLRLFHFGYRFKYIPRVLTTIRIHETNNEKGLVSQYDHWKRVAMGQYSIKSKLPLKVAYLLPGTTLCGGIAVILQHLNRLQDRGYDVLGISLNDNPDVSWFPNNRVEIVPFSVSRTNRHYLFANIDCLVATGWQTVGAIDRIYAKRKYYFVQSDERRFRPEREFKVRVEQTYRRRDLRYFTEAKWIQSWLKEEFKLDSSYVPNGLDQNLFHPSGAPRKLDRVLIEGPVVLTWKGIPDCYNAVKDLGVEIWLVSSCGDPDPSWHIDRFFSKLDHDRMAEIYSSCGIFMKMSRVEGFFGPPMEAMACGTAVVVGKCTGWDEYIVHEENALVVEQEDIAGARQAVERLLLNPMLRNKIIAGGFQTVSQWPWDTSIDALESVLCPSE